MWVVVCWAKCWMPQASQLQCPMPLQLHLSDCKLTSALWSSATPRRRVAARAGRKPGWEGLDKAHVADCANLSGENTSHLISYHLRWYDLLAETLGDNNLIESMEELQVIPMASRGQAQRGEPWKGRASTEEAPHPELSSNVSPDIDKSSERNMESGVPQRLMNILRTWCGWNPREVWYPPAFGEYHSHTLENKPQETCVAIDSLI